MSPYEADAVEIVSRLGNSESRRQILSRWLDHRSALRSIGIDQGFQWLDGSFLEEKDPKDLDVVCFFYFPESVRTEDDQYCLWSANLQLFERSAVKSGYSLDAFFLPLQMSPEALVSLSRYYLQLFSHQRESYLWKGMLQVRLEDTNDDGAKELLLVPLPAIEAEEGQV